MGVVNIFHRALWSGVAVDLGTVNTLVYMPGRGVVLDEPSVLAVRRSTGDLVAVGKPAAALWGRSPGDVEVIKPLHDGVISNPDVCSLMLQGFLARVWRRHRLGRSDAPVCVPGCATDVERRALVRAVSDGRPHFQVTLVEEPVAAALGSGVDLGAGNAMLIVDIGGGTTEMGVVVAGGTTRSCSIRVGGNEMDAAIVQAVRSQLGLSIGERTAERVKMTLGLTGNTLDSVLVGGLDPAEGGPANSASAGRPREESSRTDHVGHPLQPGRRSGCPSPRPRPGGSRPGRVPRRRGRPAARRRHPSMGENRLPGHGRRGSAQVRVARPGRNVGTKYPAQSRRPDGSPAMRPPDGDSRKLRLTILLVLIVCLFAALFARLWFLQVINGPKAQAAAVDNGVEVVYTPAPRGEILDRDGRVLVGNINLPVIEVNRQVAVQDPAVVARLAPLLGMTVKQLNTAINNLEYSPYAPVPVFPDAQPQQILYIQENPESLSGGEGRQRAGALVHCDGSRGGQHRGLRGSTSTRPSTVS